jgi:2-succinyl-6-hydroxy-2,4-cyclohexadiene-1-carboxylate synthase
MKGTIWCLHGAVGMAEDWRGFAVPGWSVKRVDLWRFLDCCPMSMPAFGDALNEEAAATPGRKVLLGYSMGGRLALHALVNGGPWEAGVIVSAHPGLRDEAQKVLRRARDAEWATKALSGNWGEFVEAWDGQAVLRTSDIELPNSEPGMKMADRGRLEGRRQAVARSFMDWTLGGQEALWERIGGIGCPLLWVVGQRDDRFCRLADELGMRLADPRSSFQRWTAEGAGHRVPWDMPGEFGKKVGEFLEALDS